MCFRERWRDLQLRGVQRQNSDSHLVLPHIPHHLLPHRLFLDLIIWLHHLLHVLLAQVALVFLLGHPCWLPASSWQMEWVGGGRCAFGTWGFSDKQGGVPGCSGQFSTADPITPAPDDSSCCSVCLFHPLRMGARVGTL